MAFYHSRNLSGRSLPKLLSWWASYGVPQPGPSCERSNTGLLRIDFGNAYLRGHDVFHQAHVSGCWSLHSSVWRWRGQTRPVHLLGKLKDIVSCNSLTLLTSIRGVSAQPHTINPSKGSRLSVLSLLQESTMGVT